MCVMRGNVLFAILLSETHEALGTVGIMHKCQNNQIPRIFTDLNILPNIGQIFGGQSQQFEGSRHGKDTHSCFIRRYSAGA